ncbi:hybrid sensor histidine kinase/response regulator [Nitrococcus mobilis]|uniref:histidine kinase n=1 Tax=Nitrococcus mobilis Nb-231 TaxID=314278 RepID=A4BSR9_9GAMM|nr:hybrid sensor histidine kinase/response regulator [Nitrococcus mobilis]EAR21163.1 Response regulator receiver:ATP-binding region, ATPase-like:Histidine kinase A, N-terminal [Nitrococcus mobilis Nb-231]
MYVSEPHKRAVVLFVDDETKALKYFARCFHREFNILTASSGDEAREILAQHGMCIAVLLTDQRMPVSDGISLLSETKARYPHIVRLLTTAYTDIGEAIAAVNRGEVWRYITKPWDLELLRGELTNALELYREQNHERELLTERRKSILSVASHIAHEMRTPLLSTRSAAAGIERYLPRLLEGHRWACEAGAPVEPLRESHKFALEESVVSIRRIVDRTNIMIDLLLANCGGKRIDPTAFDICQMGECVDCALQDFPFQTDQREWVHSQVQPSFYFRGSCGLMVFVLHNLMRNAFKAINNAGKGRIRIWTSRGETSNTLHFEDTGTGIDPKVLPEIFEDFASFSSNGKGVGIGLGFCRRVMESFGGTISCHSIPSVHTRFDLAFPLVVGDGADRS